jgi:hypothetical protein
MDWIPRRSSISERILSGRNLAIRNRTIVTALLHFANQLFEYLIYYNQALAGQTAKALPATKTTTIQSAN